MAKEAERLLAGTGWLPEPLRMADTDFSGEMGPMHDESEELPAFLADDVAEPNEGTDSRSGELTVIAAE